MSISQGYPALRTLLEQARHDLRFEVGPLTAVVAQGKVFDYYDEVRKAIAPARSELFFVDPYLNADFVTTYLPHVERRVSVRLLGRETMSGLLASVDMFAKQSGLRIQVRSTVKLHDRFLFVDQMACYLSGASFKDGAKNAPATVTQILDNEVLRLMYESIWNSAQVERVG